MESSSRNINNELQSHLEICIERLYRSGSSHHGDLQVRPEEFKILLWAKVRKLLGKNATEDEAIRIINSLHSNDLYLAFACAQHRPIAWDRFTTIYRKYIHDLTAFISPVKGLGYELAETIIADLFLPDRSGNSRIASYDGRSSLATWLRVIICHRIINEQERKFNSMAPLNDGVFERADEKALLNLEGTLRSNRYKPLIKDSLEQTCSELTDCEKLMLLLRYDNGLQLGQIGNLLGFHQATITRRIERIQAKIRQRVVSILTLKYGLDRAAIDECLAEIVENPGYSLLILIKDHQPGRGSTNYVV